MKRIDFTEGLKLAAKYGVVNEISDNQWDDDCKTTVTLGNGDKLIFRSEYDHGYYVGEGFKEPPTCWHEKAN